MTSSDDIFHTITISILDAIAIIANCILLFALVFRTPKVMQLYSVLLIYVVIVDLISGLASWLVIASVTNVRGLIVFKYVGVCTAMGPRFCHNALAIHGVCMSQSSSLMLVCFAYRLWSINSATSNNHCTPLSRLKLLGLASIATLAAMPTLVMMILSFESPGSDVIPSTSPGVAHSAMKISATRIFSLENFGGRFVMSMFTITPSIGFIAVFFVRRQLIRRIRTLRSADRHTQQLILRSLTIQVLLPATSLLAIAVWLVDLFGSVHYEASQRLVLTFCTIFSIGSPLVNLFFLPPYRRFVVQTCCGSAITAPVDRQSDILSTQI